MGVITTLGGLLTGLAFVDPLLGSILDNILNEPYGEKIASKDKLIGIIANKLEQLGTNKNNFDMNSSHTLNNLLTAVSGLAPTGNAKKLITKKINQLNKKIGQVQSTFESAQTNLLKTRDDLEKDRGELIIKEAKQMKDSGSAINRGVNLFKDFQENFLKPRS